MSSRDSDPPLDRKSFLTKGLLSLVEPFVQAIADKTRRLRRSFLRPPGAVAEPFFLQVCSRCDDCIDSCPHNAIRRAGPKYGRAEGTPVIWPWKTPCHLCEDLPCIVSCQTEALLSLNRHDVSMGVASIDRETCYAWQGQPCEYCHDSCPFPGEAIRIEEKRPRVVDSRCVGCGLCEYYCPVNPAAITVVPS